MSIYVKRVGFRGAVEVASMAERGCVGDWLVVTGIARGSALLHGSTACVYACAVVCGGLHDRSAAADAKAPVH